MGVFYLNKNNNFTGLVALGLGCLLTLAACGEEEVQNANDAGVGGQDAAVGTELEISRFAVNPTSVTAGGQATLSWTVSGPDGTTVTIAHGATTLVERSPDLTGSVSTGPVSENTTYRLTAEADGSSETETVELSVEQPATPQIQVFRGSQGVGIRFRQAEDITVEWDVVDANSIVITDEAGTEVTSSQEGTGTYTLTLPRGLYRRTLTLTATNDAGSVTATADVGTAGYINDTGAAPYIITEDDQQVVLNWDAVGDVVLTDLSTNEVIPVGEGLSEATVTVTADSSFQLEATQFGVTATGTIQVYRGVRAENAQPNDLNIVGTLPAGGQLDFTYDLNGGDTIVAWTRESTNSTCSGRMVILDSSGERAGTITTTGLCYYYVRDAPAGTYTVRVMAAPGATADAEFYMHAEITPAVCGNGTLTRNSGETCDDGDTVAGDGCDADCHIENSDTLSIPGSVDVDIAAEASGYYPMSIADNSLITLETAMVSGGDCEELGLSLIDGQSNVFYKASGACPEIAALLDPGEYLARATAGEEAVSGVRITATDHAASFPEVSDGSDTAGPVAVQTYDALPGVSFLHLNQPRSLVVRSSSCNSDARRLLTLARRDSSNALAKFGRRPTSNVILGVATSSAAGCPALDAHQYDEATSLPAGDYMVGYVNYDGDFTGTDPNIRSADLDFEFHTPGCLNGILEPQNSEECDESSATATCSGTCAWIGPVEAEPNGSQETASFVSTSTVALIQGSLSEEGDEDYYRLTLTETTSLTLVAAGNIPYQCPGDTVLAVYGSDGLIASNDDNSGGSQPPAPCSRLDVELESGTYYVYVAAYYGVTIDSYFLHLLPGD